MQVFDEACQKYPQGMAFTNMGVGITYSELNQKVQDFAAFLQFELKLKKGDRIALQMPNMLQFPIALFGALRSGLTVVNTNPLYTAKEMLHQFKDSEAKAIVIMANYGHLLEQILKETKIESVVVTELGDLFPFPKSLIVNSVIKYVKKMVPAFNLPQAYTFKQALELGQGKTPKSVECTLSDVAFLQYTGGTTGISKGAVLTHSNIIANMQQICVWMTPLLKEGQEVCITPLPMYHIFSLTVNCLAFMKYGTHNILITNPRDIPALVKDMKKHHFTIMTGVNTLFNALLNNEEFTKMDFSRVKMSVGGAMALQTSVTQRWKAITKSVLVEGYGLTETSPVACCNPIDGHDIVGTIGLPLPSTDIKLVDDDENEVPMGQPGELCVKGPQVMQGYLNRPDETAKVLKNGWLHTGDVAVVDENGYFKIVDRKKDMILVSGFNVYPNEVEEAIASHPGVLEVAAIGVPNEHSGEVVKAFVVKKDPSLTAEQVIAHAKKSLTNYKVPKEVEFKTELPKTNVGKILRRALRDQPPSASK
ncbi:AMP-binding protein [Bdellovibrio sp. HCB337]|uniref:AMP-binding protein n=1 Tax=Bdellovibrio sp. HCB337 TaxID=3394358 RepID=UPI0039A69C6B